MLRRQIRERNEKWLAFWESNKLSLVSQTTWTFNHVTVIKYSGDIENHIYNSDGSVSAQEYITETPLLAFYKKGQAVCALSYK